MIFPRTSKFSSKICSLHYFIRKDMWWRAKIIFENYCSNECPQVHRYIFCWLDRRLLKNVYDLAKNFQIFFKNMLLTLFHLERHMMESKNYFCELIFILMPIRVSRRFLLIGPSFAEKRVWFSQELPNFPQKYVAYTILSRKTCDGEQKLFLRINLHINARKGIETIYSD